MNSGTSFFIKFLLNILGVSPGPVKSTHLLNSALLPQIYTLTHNIDE